MAGLASNNLQLLFTIKGDGSQARSELNKLSQASTNSTTGIKKDFDTLSASLASFAGNLAANAVSELSSQLLSGAKAVLDYSSRLEQSKVGFTTIMGSAEAATKHLKELQDFAKTTPFAFEGLVNSSRRLQGVGVAAEKVIPLMRDVGNAAAAAGASSEQLDRITLAFSQIIAKGKLSAEEVNQLAESGIPAWKILEDQLGKSKGEIIKLAEQGAISSDIFIKAFQKFSQANFGDAMAKQSKTFAGAMSNIEDAVMITASKAFEPLYGEISKLAVRASEEIEAQGNDIEAVGSVIGQYLVNGFTQVVKAGLSGAINSVIQGFKDRTDDLLSGDLLAFSLFNTKRASFVGKGLLDGLFGEDVGSGVANKIKEAAAEVDKLGKIADNTPSLAGKLDAEKAAKEAEKLREKLNDIATDLALKIRFFGDESEVAATKQKLLNLGISDFENGSARAILQMAASIDKLKEAQKAQEEYNQKLKTTQEELTKLRSDAEFELRFPNANELDKFNRWVQSSASNFRELKGEINLTAQAIKNLLIQEKAKDRDSAISEFVKSIEDLAKKAPTFESTLKDILEPFKLKKEDLNAIIANSKFWIAEYYESLSKARNEEEKEFSKKQFNTTALDFFKQFKSSEGIELFATGSFNVFDKLIELWRILETTKATENMQRLREALIEIAEAEKAVADASAERRRLELESAVSNSVGQARLTALIKLRDFEIAEAERQNEARQDRLELELEAAFASVKGKEDEEAQKAAITEIYRQKALLSEEEFQIRLQEIKDSFNPGIEQGEAQEGAGVFAPIVNGIGEYLENIGILEEANGRLQFSFSNTFKTIADLGMQAFGQLAAGFGQMIANWVLGTGQGESSLRKLTATILANVAQTAATYAIMCLAAAALASTVFGAALMGGTPAQFLAAAAIFGAVALGTALVGRAVAGDKFKNKDAAQGAFNQQSAASTGGSRSGQSGGAFSGEEDLTINANRNSPFSQSPVQNTVIIKDKSGVWEKMFEIEFVNQMDKNTRIRREIKKISNG
jgi:tape measure domain-containing protein